MWGCRIAAATLNFHKLAASGFVKHVVWTFDRCNGCVMVSAGILAGSFFWTRDWACDGLLVVGHWIPELVWNSLPSLQL